jgi:hypothetical protein
MPSWIYEIIEKETNISIYVGSTTGKYFCLRKASHTRPSQFTNGKQPILYNYIQEKGGWDKFNFGILNEYNHIEKNELLTNEKNYIVQKIPICNKNLPILTQEEKREKRRIKAKKFRENNPDYNKRYINNEKQINYTIKRCSTKIDCECGGKYSLQNKTNHISSQKHKTHFNL